MASRRQYIASVLILVIVLSIATAYQLVREQDVIIVATMQPFSMVVLVQPTSDAKRITNDSFS